MNHWSTIKETVTNLPNIIWTFLYKFFLRKNTLSPKLYIFLMQILLLFFLLNLSFTTRKLTFKETFCISSHFLEFLYFENPIFEFNSTNYCSIFFITSWFPSLLKCSSEHLSCFAVLSLFMEKPWMCLRSASLIITMKLEIYRVTTIGNFIYHF